MKTKIEFLIKIKDTSNKYQKVYGDTPIRVIADYGQSYLVAFEDEKLEQTEIYKSFITN